MTGLLVSCDRVQMVDSAAGVGKSTMLGVYDEGMKLAGKTVTYLATTTPAVGVLREDGFDAETVAKFLLSDKMQAAARDGYVVVDESSMLGLRDAHRLFTLAKEKNLKLVFLGDSRQHSSRCRRGGYAADAGIWRHHALSHHRDQAAEERRPQGGGRAHVPGQDRWKGSICSTRSSAGSRRSRTRRNATGQWRRSTCKLLKGGTKWNEILVMSPTHAEGQRVTEAIRELMRAEKTDRQGRS